MELTTQNLYDFLVSQQIDEKKLVYDKITGIDFRIKDYNELIFSLLDEFFNEYKIKPMFPTPGGFAQGGMVYLNNRVENKICCNITSLSFISYYPNIIIKLLEIGKSYNYEIINHMDDDPFGEEKWNDLVPDGIVCNIPEFGELYKFMVQNKDIIKEQFNNEHINRLLKILINMTYGVFGNLKMVDKENGNWGAFNISKKVNVNNFAMISSVGRDIINIFIDTYPNNVIYTDTDEIYFLDFDSIKNDVEEKLEELNYPYEYNKYLYGVFLQKKNYMLTNDTNTVVRGLNNKIDKLRPITNRALQPGGSPTNENIFIGQRAGSNMSMNVAIGTSALNNITTGTNSGNIGYPAITHSSSSGLSNSSGISNSSGRNDSDRLFPRGTLSGIEIFDPLWRAMSAISGKLKADHRTTDM